MGWQNLVAVLGASPAGGGKLKVKNQNAKLWSRFAGLFYSETSVDSDGRVLYYAHSLYD